MTPPLHVGIGLVLAFAGWAFARAIARALWRPRLSLLLDAAVPAAAFGLMLTLTARPIVAGVATLALAGGFAVADMMKRAILLEPIVFVDVYQSIDIFRNPQVNMLSAGNGFAVAGALATVGIVGALGYVEPAAWPWSPWPPAILFGLIVLACWGAAGPFLDWAARRLRRLQPVGDALRDSASMGPFAMQFAHGLIARAERPARRAAQSVSATQSAAPEKRDSFAGPSRVVVVQCESFFDPRRLDADITPDLLPAFDACRDGSVQWGRLSVPALGANTARTEFAVLTGLSEDQIGFDRFNPYHAFARAPLPSLARAMRDAGYLTICLHPFDRTFYRRDLVIPNLGFDIFLGEEAFAGATRNGLYIADSEVARVAAELMAKHRQPIFLFAITMENHGPWRGQAEPGTPAVAANRASVSETSALGRFIWGTRGADAMVGILSDALATGEDPGILAFYGDHPPSFPDAFRTLGFADRRTDYFIWHGGDGAASRKDLAAHELSAAILAAVNQRRPATVEEK